MSELVARSRVLGPLYAYWCAKAAAGRLPHRRDIDPAEIPSLLPNLCFVYREPDGGFRFGLAGEAIVRHYGTNVANKPFGALLAGERLAAANHHHALAWDSRRPLWCRSRYVADGLPECVITRILLPLAGNDGAVGALLVAFGYECSFVPYKELGHEWHIVRCSDEIRFLDADPGEPASDAASATRSSIRDAAAEPLRARPAA